MGSGGHNYGGATYRIIGVGRDGKVVEGKRQGAPDDQWLCTWGDRKKVPIVIRYMPSRKAWVVLHIGNAQRVNKGGFRTWIGHARLAKTYPSEDAAVMTMLHKLGCT